MTENVLPSPESIGERSSVADQTAVVTGGSSGIGRTITETFVADGDDVVICSRTRDDVETVAAELNVADLPGSILPVEADVTGRDDVATLRAAAVNEFGDVDILVNNAGGGRDLSRLEDVDGELAIGLAHISG